MRQTIKKLLWAVGLVFSLQSVWAFSLLGPSDGYPGLPATFGDAWEVPLIGYNPLLLGAAPPFFTDPLQVGPKNLGEEYRRNTPVMYYASDANFLDYFGSNGLVALDGAFAILNQVFTNTPAVAANGIDAFSTGLTEFPLNSESVNYAAQSLELLDLKSTTLALLLEQLGLADAVRYTWALHDRYLPPGAVCNPPGPGVGVEYLVVQRNFDITASPLNQIQYSPYVNGELYNYFIDENCGLAGASPPDADALEIPVDPLFNNPPVASGNGEGFLGYGTFYTGLTRDDVAGLRYLLSTNNINHEDTAVGSLLISSTSGGTNFGAPFVLYTSNYTALVQASITNDPVTLVTLFPGLVVSSTTTNFVVAATPTVVAFFTNYIGAPAGSPPQLILYTNFTYAVVTNYADTFANVIIITNDYRTNTSAKLLTITVGLQVGAPAGSPLVTNTSVQTITLTNVPSGDYYILTNPCGPNVILSTLLTNVVATTNLIVAAVNPAGFVYSQSLVTYATNHVYIAEPLVCAGGGSVGQANITGLYQGVGKLQFVRANYDSLLGQFFQPITNIYTMTFITNSQAIHQTFQRVVTTPDFLFSAADEVSGPSAPFAISTFGRNVTFDLANIYPLLAGPGIINPPSQITFDKVGPVYYNIAPNFVTGPNFFELISFIWGSFDGTTNAPVVYPNGTSIENLAAEVLIQISPTSLPNGTNGVAYPTVTLSATGGQSPYNWSLASGTQLPLGLNLSGAVISGTPTNNPVGPYVFTIQMTDSAARTVNVNYSVTITN